ncbi:MAG: phosphate ABC transporter permease PstA [Abditibacteriaceae bacterium]
MPKELNMAESTFTQRALIGTTSPKRRMLNWLMYALTILATILAIIPLILVLYYVTVRGLGVLNWQFFSQVQAPPGNAGGGLKHAIAGTLLIVGMASVLGLPSGILGGIYLAEFGNNRFGWWVRFAADVLNGVPSIVVGIFVYALVILPMPNPHFSAWAGSLALGIMMVPTVMRTTEEIIRLVPTSLRDASLALGATRSFTMIRIVLNAAKGGVVTGVLLAIARIAGETAPLLFTALGNNFFSLNPNQPIASLPVTIFNFAMAADDRWNALAWGGSLVLVLMVLVLSIAARYFTRGEFTLPK